VLAESSSTTTTDTTTMSEGVESAATNPSTPRAREGRRRSERRMRRSHVAWTPPPYVPDMRERAPKTTLKTTKG
jgi:hypothetical protein